ncbi:MAG TPA: hypothetical protein VLK33_13830, partial [Terriglobales bacterium]|nr:hypothetical protein [Terriglobales bacterium]
LLGYWPQKKQVQAIEQENVQLKAELASSQALGRIARLQNELLLLIEQTESQNYGEAQKLSNSFFDDVRKEIDRDKGAPFLTKLETILARRDAVTAGLAKAEAPTIGALRQSLTEMRELVFVLSR